MKNTTNIDFWGIGAQKSGTSWLFFQLNSLQEFSLLPIKELHYFDRSPSYPSPNKLSQTELINRIKDDKTYLKKSVKKILGVIKKRKLNEARFYYNWYLSNYNDEWYISLFKPLKGIRGEITPSYSILNKIDIKKMYALAPNAKLILMLRNPIDRAWSHYRFNSRRKKSLFYDGVSNRQIIEFIESDGQSLRSNYIRTLRNYSSVFPKEQILIGFYDAIVDNPHQLLTDITNFLGLDTVPTFKIQNMDKMINKSLEQECPQEVYGYLKKKYHDQIKELADQYGGYFNKWYTETYKKGIHPKQESLLPTICLKS